MIKRMMAFFVDNIALNLCAIWSSSILNLDGVFWAANIQFFSVLLVVYLQHQFWRKTLGMHIFGLKIACHEGPNPSRRLFLLTPFFVYYGICYLWAMNDFMADVQATSHWLVFGGRNEPLYGGIMQVQTIFLLVFVAMILAPQFLGEKRMGWEALAKCEIVDEYKKS